MTNSDHLTDKDLNIVRGAIEACPNLEKLTLSFNSYNRIKAWLIKNGEARKGDPVYKFDGRELVQAPRKKRPKKPQQL